MPKTRTPSTKENAAFGLRLTKLLADNGQPRHGAGAYLAKKYQVANVTANAWLNGEYKPNTDLANQIAMDHGLSFNELYFGERASNALPTGYVVREAGADEYVGNIQFMEARGSCGGGSINWEFEQRLPLIKEASWFKRFRIKPEDALAIWADGDSMAEFIVDGDIVIFDTSKTRPRSGAIFLVDHPDGLKIKRLRRKIDGSWVLESANVDKQRYPDEVIGTEQESMLKILGEFVYRQGG